MIVVSVEEIRNSSITIIMTFLNATNEGKGSFTFSSCLMIATPIIPFKIHLPFCGFRGGENNWALSKPKIPKKVKKANDLSTFLSTCRQLKQNGGLGIMKQKINTVTNIAIAKNTLAIFNTFLPLKYIRKGCKKFMKRNSYQIFV